MPATRKVKPAARPRAVPPLSASPDDELVSVAQLPAFGIRYSRNWLRQLIRQGAFPEPCRPTLRRLCWTRRQLEEWIAAARTGSADAR
jgi:predicted DNA-binding transcriptional regulator AlpA